MNTIPLCSVLLTTASLLASGLPQHPVDSPQAPPAPIASRIAASDEVTPVHTAPADGDVPYGVWAAGARYKASFHDGAVFVPYLGQAYPQVQSLRWCTTSVRCGDQELATKAPRASWSEYRVEYDLGGVVEAYDVRASGLEQTFVLAQRPTGRGDLIIRGSLTTELHASDRAPGHSDVVFVDAAGQSILSYGAATAIDAAGRKQPMTTAMQADGLELRLDRAWLEQASFPLVIDPLLGVIYSNSGGENVGSIDLLRDDSGTSGNLWLATERWAAANDADLRLRRVDDDGQSSTLVFTDITTSWSSAEPSLGLHLYAHKTLLVFSRDFAVTNIRRLRWHAHDRADFTLQTGVLTIDSNDQNAWRPDVATDYTAGATDSLLVVFQRDGAGNFINTTTSTIYGSLIDLGGVAGPSFPIAANGTQDHERPTVGKIQSGGAGNWAVAWQVISNGAGSHPDWDLELCRVNRSAVVTAATNVDTGQHDLAPRLAGVNDTQVLAWTRASTAVVGTRPIGANGEDLQTRRYDWDGTSFQWSNAGWYVSSNPDARVQLTGIDVDRTTRSHYLLTYRSTVTDNVYLASLGYRGHVVAPLTVWSAGIGENSVSGAVTYDEDAEQFVLGYGVNHAAVAYAHIDRYAHPTAAAITTTGIGCGTGQLSWIGSQLIGDEGVTVRLDNVAPGALMVVLLGTTTVNTALLGVPAVHNGCWLLVPNTGVGSLGFLPLGIGPAANWSLDLPEWLDPMTLRIQGFHFDGANTEVFTTQRLNVPIVK